MGRRAPFVFHAIAHKAQFTAEDFKSGVPHPAGMVEDEGSDLGEGIESVPSEVLVDEDRDDMLEEMTLETRLEALKRARWNVFMFLGVAVIMFAFALFPMPFNAEYQSSYAGAQATKDVGLIWGMPIPGNDVTDVPVRVTVDVESPPPSHYQLVGYMIHEKDCMDSESLSTGQDEAEADPTGEHAYATSEGTVVGGESVDLRFRVDPGQYCLIVKFLDSDGNNADDSGTAQVTISGRVWPNQAIAGLFGLTAIVFAALSFVGAQRHGFEVREMQQPKEESVEQSVLAAAGPSGPPAAGPSGPPAAGPAGPPAPGPESGPPEQHEDVAQAAEPVEAPPSTPAVLQQDEDGTTWLDAGHGYVHRRMPDGSYDQTVWVPNSEGTGFVPHEG